MVVRIQRCAERVDLALGCLEAPSRFVTMPARKHYPGVVEFGQRIAHRIKTMTGITELLCKEHVRGRRRERRHPALSAQRGRARPLVGLSATGNGQASRRASPGATRVH